LRISWVEMGWPGSVHDNGVWVNSEIYLSKDKYFEQKEYLLGDSAFLTSAVMIPAFKKGHTRNLSKEQRHFNNKLAKIRIKSEQCIGLLKAWFQRLRVFWRVIQDKQDLDAILRQAMCACILHNLHIDNLVLPDCFIETIEELDQDDELNQSMEQSGRDTRRNHVFAYMLEER